MTEVEKMRSSRLADMAVLEIQERFAHAKALLARMGGMSTYEDGYRKLLEELVPGIPETSIIWVRLSIVIMEMESNWASTFLSMPIVHSWMADISRLALIR